MSNLTLSISHLIFLTKQQRYDYFDGKDIEVVGVSLPVWMNKTKTSEPATEVFVKYTLLNRDEKPLVKHNYEGYEIVLNSDYGKNEHDYPCIKELLDIKDGGTEWIAFKQNRRLRMKSGKELTLIHFVQIKSIEDLENTIKSS